MGSSFAYVHGAELELNPDLLGDTSIDFIDSSLLLKDFLFLFSFSPAKNLTKNTATQKVKAYAPALNYRDGIVILLRGDSRALDPFLSFSEELMHSPRGVALKKPSLLISEIGNQKNAKADNDYILLYNPNDFPLSLAGLYLGRDSSCNLENGWSEYQPLPLQWIEAHSYFLVSREDNDLNADWTWRGSIGEHYCIVLSVSPIPPASLPSSSFSLDDSQIIDFVYFNDLKNESSYKRKGKCQGEESGHFTDDFFKTQDIAMPFNKESRPCL